MAQKRQFAKALLTFKQLIPRPDGRRPDPAFGVLDKRFHQGQVLFVSLASKQPKRVAPQTLRAGSPNGSFSKHAPERPIVRLQDGSWIDRRQLARMANAVVGSQGRLPVPRTNFLDRKSTRLNSSHIPLSRMPSSA